MTADEKFLAEALRAAATPRLLTFPEDAARLRRVALPVPPDLYGSATLRGIGDVLGRVMLDHRGAGLAATQLDLDPCYRVVAFREAEDQFSVLCDPVLVGEFPGEWASGPEGCLSFASVTEVLPAPPRVVVRFRDQQGVEQTVMQEGFRARCVWHEIRHLEGLLMVDLMGEVQRMAFMKRVREKRRDGERVKAIYPKGVRR